MSSPITGHPLVGRAYPYEFTTALAAQTFTLSANQTDTAIYLGSVATTLVLPAISTLPSSCRILVRNSATANVALTLKGSGSDNIGAANTATINQTQSMIVLSDWKNAKWQILFGPA